MSRPMNPQSRVFADEPMVRETDPVAFFAKHLPYRGPVHEVAGPVETVRPMNPCSRVFKTYEELFLRGRFPRSRERDDNPVEVFDQMSGEWKPASDRLMTILTGK